MRKVTKTKASFPSEEAALKLLFLKLRRVEKKWTMPIFNWTDALNYLMVSHHERVSPYLS